MRVRRVTWVHGLALLALWVSGGAWVLACISQSRMPWAPENKWGVRIPEPISLTLTSGRNKVAGPAAMFWAESYKPKAGEVS